MKRTTPPLLRKLQRILRSALYFLFPRSIIHHSLRHLMESPANTDSFLLISFHRGELRLVIHPGHYFFFSVKDHRLYVKEIDDLCGIDTGNESIDCLFAEEVTYYLKCLITTMDDSLLEHLQVERKEFLKYFEL